MKFHHLGCPHFDDLTRYYQVYDIYHPADQTKESISMCKIKENLEYLVNGVPLLVCLAIVVVMFIIKSQRVSGWTIRVYSVARL